MTTKYFLLTKNKDVPLTENDQNQLVFLIKDLRMEQASILNTIGMVYLKVELLNGLNNC